MAHVELSLSEVFAPATPYRPAPESGNCGQHRHGLRRRRALPADRRRTTRRRRSRRPAAGCSASAAPARLIGRPLLDGGLRLLDFTANRCELTEQEIDKIPPLLALSSGRLARGLLRVLPRPRRRPGPDGRRDLHAGAPDGTVAGSLTFFSEV